MNFAMCETGYPKKKRERGQCRRAESMGLAWIYAVDILEGVGPKNTVLV